MQTFLKSHRLSCDDQMSEGLVTLLLFIAASELECTARPFLGHLEEMGEPTEREIVMKRSFFRMFEDKNKTVNQTYCFSLVKDRHDKSGSSNY